MGHGNTFYTGMGNYCNSTLDFDKILQIGEHGCGFRDLGALLQHRPGLRLHCGKRTGNFWSILLKELLSGEAIYTKPTTPLN